MFSGLGLCVALITRPLVVCLNAIVKPGQRGGPGSLGASNRERM